MQKTTIEYLTHTWNPVKMKCTKCSPGCENCWHLEQAEMRKNNPKLPQRLRDVYSGAGKPYLDEKELNCSMPKKPARIGVQFMGDPLHSGVSFDWLDKIMAVIALNPQHTFMILTKRPERMLEYFSDKDRWIFIEGQAQKIYHERTGEDPELWLSVKLPLPNLWIGVTVCNQEEADRNIPVLLRAPAEKRFVSIEPMLGEIILTEKHIYKNGMRGILIPQFWRFIDNLDCIICGGESGRNARPLNPDHVISLRDQCEAANTPFFFKQWGEYEYKEIDHYEWHKRKVGVKKAGNLLQGKTYEQLPEVK